MLPETLHNRARNSRHLCPKYSVNSTRVLGHKCSCPWGYVFFEEIIYALFILIFEENHCVFEENIVFFAGKY